MNFFKKFAVVFAIFLSLVLIACGKKTTKENTTKKPTSDDVPTTTKTNKSTNKPADGKYSLNIKTNVDGCSVLTDKDEYSIGDTVTLTGIGNDQYDCVGFVALNSKSMDYSDVKYVFSYSDTFTFTLGDVGHSCIPLDLLDCTYAIFAPKGQVCVMSFNNTQASLNQFSGWFDIDSTIKFGQYIFVEGKAIDYAYDYYPIWNDTEGTSVVEKLYIPFDYTFNNPNTRLYVFNVVIKNATTYNLSIAPDSLDNGSVSYSTTEGVSYYDATGNVKGIIEENTEVTLYAIGKTQSFMGWYEYGTDNLVSNQTPYTFTMTSNVKLTAKWPSTAVTYTLTTLNDNSNAGSITSYTNEEFNAGTEVTLKATANTGYRFDGWYNGEEKLSANPTYLFNITSNLAITAKWYDNSITTTYSFTTINSNSSLGTIPNYTFTFFPAGTVITLTATPKEGGAFEMWYDSYADAILSYNTTYTFTINADTEILGCFNIACTLKTINDNPSAGTISTTTNYTGEVLPQYAAVTLTATANTGYSFDGWYNGSTRVSTSTSYTFNINSNLTLTAKWTSGVTPTTYTLTTINDKTYAGSITSYTDKEFNAGSSVTLTATVDPESGYTFDGWYDGTTRKSTNEVYTFTINSNLTLTAKWTYYTVTTKPCYNSGNDVPDSMDYYYIAGNFKTLNEEKVTVGETIQIFAAPKEKSVTWVGWYKQTGNHTDGYTYTLLSNELSFPYEMTNENVVIVAKFLLYKVLATDSGNNPTIIEYGYYPQSLVDDDKKAELADYIEELPTEDDSKTWTSYGYYDDDVVSNYMWYKDIDEDNDGFMDYRGVYFTKYRGNTTSSTAYSSGSAITNNDIYKNGYRSGEVYWFEYEPIVWDIVDDGGAGDKKIVSRYVLDAQEWYINHSDRPDGLNTIYANNYEYSSIREWLNKDNGFYYTVFDTFRRKNNVLNITDNSLASTGKTSNDYVCENTVDKVYLLSTKEFNDYLKNTSFKQGRPTDYAQIQGVGVQDGTGSSAGYSVYWLRTPNTSKTSAIYIGTAGSTGQNGVSNIRGIRPAIDMML